MNAQLRVDFAMKSPLVQLLSYLKPFRGRVILATAFSVLNKLFDLAPPALIGAAVDIVVKGQDSLIARLGFPDPAQQLLVLAGITALIWILESIFEYLFEVYWRYLAQLTQDALRKDAYRHMQGLELAYFEDQSTGGLISVLNDDINQLERFLDHGANDLIQVAVTVLVVGGLFVFSAPDIGWMALVPIPFIIFGSMWYQKKLGPRYTKVREKAADVAGQLANNLSGIATIKSFGTEEYENGRMSALSGDYKEANRRVIKIAAAFVPLIRMFILSGFIAILVAAGYRTLQGGMEVGLYSLLIFITQRLLWPLTTLGQTFDTFQRAMASTRRVMKLLGTKENIPSGSIPLDPQAVHGHYQFEKVSFSYRTGGRVLENLSLDIEAGKTTGIVGATGAGKSSLIKLLMRFYDVSEGRILLDGVDLRDYRLEDLVHAAGLVSQDVFLFHGTVEENIRYGSFGALDQELENAARLAEAHEFIVELPQGYKTIVGERGQKLSGGQRQRLSIARAILRNPRVLILDEATSSVDNETEAAIQRSMVHIAKDRTTIVIAHRLSTIRNADRIIVLNKGRVVEQGSHDQLLALGGIYQQLWMVQSGQAVLNQS